MHFKKNQTYTKAELLKIFNISDRTWQRKKAEIMKELPVEEKRSRTVNYTFLENCDYQYQHYKTGKSDGMEEEIKEILTKYPLNTARNVADTLLKEEKTRYSSSSCYEFVRKKMLAWFGKEIEEPFPVEVEELEDSQEERIGKILRKVWCYKDKEQLLYIPLTKEQLDYFFSKYQEISASQECAEFEIDLLKRWKKKELTNEELGQYLGELKSAAYVLTLSFFKDKYGVRPIKVPEYYIYAYTPQRRDS